MMQNTIRITRTIEPPDPIRLVRSHRNPDLGPGILFFTGGTALRPLSEKLIQFTHNSIHIMTPFDSGGSSAKLRKAFKMPAIGDVRNRLMALADRTIKGNPAIFNLFDYRFPKEGNPELMAAELDLMARGKHELLQPIPDPMKTIIGNYLHRFKKRMPEDFDLRKASIGNLILTSGFLENEKHLAPVIFMFSKLLPARGVVRPILNGYLHLCAELENGKLIVGQHMLTGKETSPIQTPVKRIFISDSTENPIPIDAPIRLKTAELIHKAELICYPMGSFFSSILANLLPSGVGTAVQQNPRPKIYIPNTGKDPEEFGMPLPKRIHLLIETLRKDDPTTIKPADVLNFVLIDSENGYYEGINDIDETELAQMGVNIIDVKLISPESEPYIDPDLLIPILLSLA